MIDDRGIARDAPLYTEGLIYLQSAPEHRAISRASRLDKMAGLVLKGPQLDDWPGYDWEVPCSQLLASSDR